MKVGYEELAKAVIEQWDYDGQPKNDRQSIEIWHDILRRLKS